MRRAPHKAFRQSPSLLTVFYSRLRFSRFSGPIEGEGSRPTCEQIGKFARHIGFQNRCLGVLGILLQPHRSSRREIEDCVIGSPEQTRPTANETASSVFRRKMLLTGKACRLRRLVCRNAFDKRCNPKIPNY